MSNAVNVNIFSRFIYNITPKFNLVIELNCS